MSLTTEVIHEGNTPSSARTGIKHPGPHVDVHSGPSGFQVTREADEVVDDAKYLDDLEKDIPGVESGFHKAITLQSKTQANRGRAAILRMSHPHYPDRDVREDLVPRQIKWQKLPGPSSRPQSSTSTAIASESPEAPEGLTFDNLDHFKQALKILPRRFNKSEVPRFFNKQLVVLEDLGKDWVETVGKAFHIPPSVFALHWASPSLYKSGRARVPLGQPAEEHFVLPYSEILPDGIKGGMVFFSGK